MSGIRVNLDGIIAENQQRGAWYVEHGSGSFHHGLEAIRYGIAPLCEVTPVPAGGYKGRVSRSSALPYVNVSLLGPNELVETMAQVTDHPIDPWEEGASISQLEPGRLDVFVAFGTDAQASEQEQEEYLRRSLSEDKELLEETLPALEKKGFAYVAAHLLVEAVNLGVIEACRLHNTNTQNVTTLKTHVRKDTHRIFCDGPAGHDF